MPTIAHRAIVHQPVFSSQAIPQVSEARKHASFRTSNYEAQTQAQSINSTVNSKHKSRVQLLTTPQLNKPNTAENVTLTAMRLMYLHLEVRVRVNGATTKPFKESVGSRKGCSLSLILSFIYIDRIVKKSESCGEVEIGDSTIHLLFADDLVQLEYSQNGLQQALDWFSDACFVA